MKKLILLTVIIFSAFYSASAQYYYSNNSTNGPKIGFGISSGFATGPVSGTFPEAGEITANLELPLGKSPVSVLFQTGYTFYVSNSGYGADFGYYGYGYSAYYYGDVASFIPVEAGLKVYLARRVFIAGLAGISFNVNAIPSDYTGQANAFIYQPALGYSFPFGYRGKSNLDVSLMYENRPETGGGYSQVALRAVWNFGL
ncbi:MAG TPA: hypothetical protein VFE53_13855 [Mucilaginibacter sp.]|jgi:hypothetical protein|nr:hypothetical protein [Mucilaginibacter sp.]